MNHFLYKWALADPPNCIPNFELKFESLTWVWKKVYLAQAGRRRRRQSDDNDNNNNNNNNNKKKKKKKKKMHTSNQVLVIPQKF